MQLLTLRQTFNLKSAPKIFIWLFFICVFGLGLYIHKDFGISMDESTNRERGIISINYIGDLWNIRLIQQDSVLSQFKHLPPLNQYLEGHGGSAEHGPLFDIFAVSLERLLNIGGGINYQKIYQFRHLLNFLVFFVGLIALYQLSFRRFRSRLIGAITVLLMLLSPRFFAESFYNTMDLVFLALFTIALNTTIEYLLKPNIRNVIICAITCGLAIDMRITGIALPIMIVSVNILQTLRGSIIWQDASKNILIFSAVICIVIITFWPWLWAQPLHNFFYALKVLSKIPVNLNLLYFGQIIPVTNIPWHYPLVWIGITTPILYLLLFFVGFISTTINFLQRNFQLWQSNNELQDWLFWAIFFCPLIAVITLHSVLYDGWRHLYFVYPAFLLIATKGIVIVWNFFKSTALKFTLISLVSLNLVGIVFWMIQAHPLQNVFFNSLMPHEWKSRFEVDYWGLSAKQGLEYIAKIDDRELIEILPGGLMNLDLASKILDPNIANRFKLAIDSSSYDYLITNFRTNPSAFTSSNLIPLTTFDVHGETVLAVYQHKNDFPIGKPIKMAESITFSSQLYQDSNPKDLSSFILGIGWSRPELWGTWSNSKTSTLIFSPDNFVQPFELNRVELLLKGFVLPNHPLQTVEIYINNTLIKTVILNSPAITSISLPLPKITSSSTPFELKFKLPNAVSPFKLGVGNDKRTLAIGLISATFY